MSIAIQFENGEEDVVDLCDFTLDDKDWEYFFPNEVSIKEVEELSQGDTILAKRIDHERIEELVKIRQYGYSLKNVSERFRDDEEVVLKAIKKHASDLQYVSDRLRNDKKIVLSAVARNGSMLKDASEILQNDKDVVLVAIKSWANAVQYASVELKQDREIAFSAVENNRLSLQHIYIYHQDKSYYEDLIECALEYDGWALEYAPEVMKNNEKVVLKAINDTPYAINFASETLLNSDYIREMVFTILDGDNGMYQYLPEQFKHDREICLTAIEDSYDFAAEFVSERLGSDNMFKEICSKMWDISI